MQSQALGPHCAREMRENLWVGVLQGAQWEAGGKLPVLASSSYPCKDSWLLC